MAKKKTKEVVDKPQIMIDGNKGYNHYIRVNQDGYVIKSFTSAFTQPKEGDILIKENAPEAYTDLQCFDMVKKIPAYKYVDGKVIELSDAEKIKIIKDREKQILKLEIPGLDVLNQINALSEAIVLMEENKVAEAKINKVKAQLDSFKAKWYDLYKAQ